ALPDDRARGMVGCRTRRCRRRAPRCATLEPRQRSEMGGTATNEPSIRRALHTRASPPGVLRNAPLTGCGQTAFRTLRSYSRHFIHRSLLETDDEQVAVGSSPNVSGDSKALPKQQTLAFGNIPLVEIVRPAVEQERIAERQIHAIVAQRQPEQLAIQQKI